MDRRTPVAHGRGRANARTFQAPENCESSGRGKLIELVGSSPAPNEAAPLGKVYAFRGIFRAGP
jgi:hypothetical protein